MAKLESALAIIVFLAFGLLGYGMGLSMPRSDAQAQTGGNTNCVWRVVDARGKVYHGSKIDFVFQRPVMYFGEENTATAYFMGNVTATRECGRDE